jgi:hypothetical protein
VKVAYVAGKYRAPTVRGIVENIRRAEEVALWLWRNGWAVVCPHLNTALLDGACEDAVWLEGGLEILRRCDALVLVPGWESSEGTRAEYIAACDGDLLLYEWTPDGLRPDPESLPI